MRNRMPTLVALAGLLLVPVALMAQPNNATIQATATVLTPLTVTATADLDFGTNVFPSVNASVLPTDGTAGQFDLAGVANAEVDLDFGTLPGVLNGSGAAAGDNLTISFSATDAGYGTSQPAQTPFDPAAGAQPRLDAGTGLLSVWIGGTVAPRADQTAGPYAADITLTVNYTGN
jgi:hypothetical protein